MLISYLSHLILRPRPSVFLLSSSVVQRTASHNSNSQPSASSSLPIPAEAHAWVARFTKASIPRGDVEVTFARSSGPGGQNVNKVNTKAVLRCRVDNKWIPPWAQDALMRTPAYVASSQSILITSTQHRSQTQNVEDCFDKLHTLIHSTCLAVIPTPADPTRLARKESYERAAKARARAQKMYRSAIKRGRKGD